eukprot:TRINITY_DN109110_c0_g1_i1.p1 TRINITY_DN109110_c0_g1~~TRINITY_DN109110_c0_g1_i1.p1  ORF type:complete len:227 (-),score=26.16 TRINITY_DN109110_c0_g1_i1:77-757(-)
MAEGVQLPHGAIGPFSAFYLEQIFAYNLLAVAPSHRSAVSSRPSAPLSFLNTPTRRSEANDGSLPRAAAGTPISRTASRPRPDLPPLKQDSTCNILAEVLQDNCSPLPAATLQRLRPQLLLPIPPRGASPGASGLTLEDTTPPATLQPLDQVLPSLTEARYGQRSSKFAQKAKPARLQPLDDQTTLPREVYERMLQLGHRARGRLGYAQHKLTFTGPEGVPVLRRS